MLYLTRAADGRYYKRVKSLPATWKYVSATASALVARLSDRKFEAMYSGANSYSVVSGHLVTLEQRHGPRGPLRYPIKGGGLLVQGQERIGSVSSWNYM